MAFKSVAGLLPQLLQYWFQPKRTISSYADANTLTETGIYRLAWESGGFSNFPLNINIYCYGFLLVFAMDSENFVQVVINESNQICVRQLFDKTYWRPWVQVV